MATSNERLFRAKAVKKEKYKVVYETRESGLKGIFSITTTTKVKEDKLGVEYHLVMEASLDEFDKIYVNGKQINIKQLKSVK